MEQRIPTYPRLFRKFFKRLSGLDKCTKLANLCMRRLIYPKIDLLNFIVFSISLAHCDIGIGHGCLPVGKVL